MAIPFDLRTQRLNKKGQVISSEPYILYVENGKQVYERPPHSGNFYYSTGEVADAEDRPAVTAVNQKKQKDEKAKVSEKQLRTLNDTLKDHAAQGKGQVGGVMDAPKLDSADQAALDSLIGEEEQISATQPKEKTNAEAEKKGK